VHKADERDLREAAEKETLQALAPNEPSELVASPDTEGPTYGLQYWRAEKLKLASFHPTRDTLKDYRDQGLQQFEPDKT